MQRPAPYTRETVDLIRAQAKLGAAALAEMLGWDEQRLRSTAKKHGIVLSERPPQTTQPAPEPEVVGSGRVGGFRQSYTSQGRLSASLKAHPRDCYATISISKAASAALDEIAKAGGKRTTGVAGIVLDFIARNGELAALYARAEEEAA